MHNKYKLREIEILLPSLIDDSLVLYSSDCSTSASSALLVALVPMIGKSTNLIGIVLLNRKICSVDIYYFQRLSLFSKCG